MYTSSLPFIHIKNCKISAKCQWQLPSFIAKKRASAGTTLVKFQLLILIALVHGHQSMLPLSFWFMTKKSYERSFLSSRDGITYSTMMNSRLWHKIDLCVLLYPWQATSDDFTKLFQHKRTALQSRQGTESKSRWGNLSRSCWLILCSRCSPSMWASRSICRAATWRRKVAASEAGGTINPSARSRGPARCVDSGPILVREPAPGLSPEFPGLLNATVLFNPGPPPRGLARLDMPDMLDDAKLCAGALPPPAPCPCTPQNGKMINQADTIPTTMR